MAELTQNERDSMVAEIFQRTGVPLSKDDPLFAMAELLSMAQDRQHEQLRATANHATAALEAVERRLQERAASLGDLVDAYVQSRIESANNSIDAETRRLTLLAEETLTKHTQSIRDEIAETLGQQIQKICVTPIRDALDVIPQRSWMDSLWTLTACLAIGFAVGFIYFDVTIRNSLEYQLNAVTSKLQPVHAPSKK